MTSIYIGGIEGGATHSKCIICDEQGAVVASVKGPGTNHWVIGLTGCANRIAEMVTNAKIEAGIPETIKLKSLGLSLSGCEQDATNRLLENELRIVYPNLSESYVVCSDTVGSIHTASNLGGLVLISGTGSNALLLNPDGSTHGCGGWGHFMGDEGGAWWISHKAIKTVFDVKDNFKVCEHSIDTVWQLTKEHFGIANRHDLLDHCYGKFDKPFFSSLCVRLARAALEGDKLSRHVFHEAGRNLALSVIALLPRVQSKLTDRGELYIVCVGSVWLSWELLKPGFIQELNLKNIEYEIKLLKLNKTMALGACYLAADSIKLEIPRDYQNNYEEFYSYSQARNQTNGTKH